MKIEINNIYKLDCLKGLKLMKDNSVDITITSPPYNVGNKIKGKGKYTTYDDFMPMDDYYNWIKEIITELIRVSRKYVFFNFQILSNNNLAYYQLFADFKHNIKDRIIWYKSNASPAQNPFQLSSSFEEIVVFTKEEYATNSQFEKDFVNQEYFNNCKKGKVQRNVIYDPKLIYDVQRLIDKNNKKKSNTPIFLDLNTELGLTNVIYGSNSGSEKFYGRQENNAIFPEYVVEHILNLFTKEDEIVLDCFMGTGTTAYVCRNKWRNYIGFELNPIYIDIANRRINQLPSKENCKWIIECDNSIK